MSWEDTCKVKPQETIGNQEAAFATVFQRGGGIVSNYCNGSEAATPKLRGRRDEGVRGWLLLLMLLLLLFFKKSYFFLGGREIIITGLYRLQWMGSRHTEVARAREGDEGRGSDY